MLYSEKLSQGFKKYFLLMWGILQMPLSISLSLTFERGSYSSVVNLLGFFSLFATIPYTLLVGIPVGVIGVVCGVLAAPLAYLITGIMDFISWVSKPSLEQLHYPEAIDALESELDLEDVVCLGTKAKCAYNDAQHNYEELQKILADLKANITLDSNTYKDSSAFTIEERAYREKAKELYTDAKGKSEAILPVLRQNYGFFDTLIAETETMHLDCEIKLAALKG